MRAKPLIDLLSSVNNQTWYPDEILIIDGSTNDETQKVIETNKFQNLSYFLVDSEHRGLTKQRNYGISKVSNFIDIVCFLDDDTILEKEYFENLIGTYSIFPEALGVGGYLTNESVWQKVTEDYVPNINEYFFDGWKRKDGSRFVLRKKLGLDSNLPPCFLPEFFNGRSVGFLPPSNKIYEVQQFMGGVASYKKSILDGTKFSDYFEGYGLYEDADFTLRLSNIGKLYLNTAARLAHYHDGSGRPNKFLYGKMVLRNGWYVWRVKYRNPSFKARFKWNLIVFLLTIIRFSNTFTTSDRKEAFTECLGRTVGWFSLIFNKPKIRKE
jgi:glycosyltransferase involved in cell wall biosynthesis